MYQSICLINAVNIILVFQNNSPAYKYAFPFPLRTLSPLPASITH